MLRQLWLAATLLDIACPFPGMGPATALFMPVMAAIIQKLPKDRDRLGVNGRQTVPLPDFPPGFGTRISGGSRFDRLMTVLGRLDQRVDVKRECAAECKTGNPCLIS